MADPFNFADGSSAHTTQELLSILEEKDTGLTQPHVSRDDYANWVRHVLHNNTLADRLEKCRSVQQVIDVLRLEHTPKPQEQQSSSQPQSAPAQDASPKEQQPEHAREPFPGEQTHKREPIRDLHKASEPDKQDPQPQQQVQQPSKPEQAPTQPTPQPQSEPQPRPAQDQQPASGQQPKKPDPVPNQSLLDRYNAREFLMGFLAGIVLTVLIYGIIGTLA